MPCLASFYRLRKLAIPEQFLINDSAGSLSTGSIHDFLPPSLEVLQLQYEWQGEDADRDMRDARMRSLLENLTRSLPVLKMVVLWESWDRDDPDNILETFPSLHQFCELFQTQGVLFNVCSDRTFDITPLGMEGSGSST
jgi:hypothetical protein